MSSPPIAGSRRPLLTTGDAARIAGCHPVTVLRAIRSGELEATRLGRRGDHRVHVDALDRWLHPTPDTEETTR